LISQRYIYFWYKFIGYDFFCMSPNSKTQNILWFKRYNFRVNS